MLSFWSMLFLGSYKTVFKNEIPCKFVYFLITWLFLTDKELSSTTLLSHSPQKSRRKKYNEKNSRVAMKIRWSLATCHCGKTSKLRVGRLMLFIAYYQQTGIVKNEKLKAPSYLSTFFFLWAMWANRKWMLQSGPNSLSLTLLHGFFSFPVAARGPSHMMSSFPNIP